MKKVIFLIFISSVFLVSVSAQEIADVSAKSRFERSKQIYVSGGVGIVNGALGDYGVGTSFETGFMKRLNKVMSIGGGFSYLSFAYDASKTYEYYYNPDVDALINLTLSGGNVSLMSLGFNFKLNLIPVSDDTKVSIYGIATPFLSYYSRSDVSGNGHIYYNSDGSSEDDSWDKGGFPALKGESKVTGGAYLGFGVEFFPAKKFSGFVQATYGYTLPITYVSTSAYLNSQDLTTLNGTDYYQDTIDTKKSYYNDAFPIVKKGFTALSIKAGVAFNF